MWVVVALSLLLWLVYARTFPPTTLPRSRARLSRRCKSCLASRSRRWSYPLGKCLKQTGRFLKTVSNCTVRMSCVENGEPQLLCALVPPGTHDGCGTSSCCIGLSCPRVRGRVLALTPSLPTVGLVRRAIPAYTPGLSPSFARTNPRG